MKQEAINPISIVLVIFLLLESIHSHGIDISSCNPTGYENVIGCESIPSSIRKSGEITTLSNDFQTFEYEGETYRQLDLASYFFFRNRFIAHKLKVRHPFLLLSAAQTPLGSSVLEISRNSRFDFHIAIDKGPRKPRTALQADEKRLLEFRRELMCYTSASSQQIAFLISQFAESGQGYHVFKNNCNDFILLLLGKLCGPKAEQIAQFRLSNRLMSAGAYFSGPRKKAETPSPSLPVVYVPNASTRLHDLRRTLSGVEEITNALDANEEQATWPHHLLD